MASAQDVVTTQGYTIGDGPVTGATAVAQPDAAATTADYTVGFTTPTALGKGATVTLSDPKAATVFPAAKADYIIIDNTRSSADQQAASVTLASGGHAVTLGLSVPVPAGDALSVYVVGATNPASPGSYSLEVSTFFQPGSGQHSQLPDSGAGSSARLRPHGGPAYSLGGFDVHDRRLQGRRSYRGRQLAGGRVFCGLRGRQQRGLSWQRFGLQGHRPDHRGGQCARSSVHRQGCRTRHRGVRNPQAGQRHRGRGRDLGSGERGAQPLDHAKRHPHRGSAELGYTGEQ